MLWLEFTSSVGRPACARRNPRLVLPRAWCRAGVTHPRTLAPRSFRTEVFMEDRAPVVSLTEQSSTANVKHPHEGRGAWVLPAYGISGLALFGVLAYFFSDFIAH